MENQLPSCCLPTKKKSPQKIVGILVLLFVLFFILDRLGLLVFSPGTKTLAGLGSVFVFGLAASLSTCTAFSVGILTALSTSEKNKKEKQFLFHLGRILGFVVLGAVIGLLGQKITLSAAGQNFLTLIISFVLLFTGLKILGLLPEKLSRLSFLSGLKERFNSSANSGHWLAPFFLGVLTFFLPCGFTQSAQLYALSLANPLSSALVMLVFALGTLPALLGVSVLVSAGRGIWHNRIKAVAGVLIVLFGFSGFQNSLVLFGWFVPDINSGQSFSAEINNNEQIIEMTVSEQGYNPSVLRVKVGVPVRWLIHGTESMGCAQSLVSRSLSIDTNLKVGTNEITFTPTKTGTYGFSCAMGMVRGSIIVE